MSTPLTVVVGGALASAFRDPCHVRTIQVADGANGAYHRIIRSEEGHAYSIKCAKRLGGQIGDRNELLANRLAEAVGIRGSSIARKIPPIPDLGAPFDTGELVAIRWGLPKSVKILAAIESIHNAPESFLHQLGTWAVFCAAIGASDRGQQNLVWDSESRTLAHVDFEDAFRGAGNIQEQVQWARPYGNLDPAAWRRDPNYPAGVALASGVIDGNHAMMIHKSSTIESMASAGIELHVRERAAAWIELDPESKVELVKASVG